MKTNTRLIAMLTCAAATAAVSAQNPVVGDCYLYCHMSDRGEWTAYAISEDGLHYQELLDGGPVFDPEQHARIEGGTRDAYICRSHDGKKFLMVTTDMCVRKSHQWNNYGIDLYTSDDLINWESVTFDFREGAPIFSDPQSPDPYKDYSTIRRVWAPQIFWNPEYVWPDGSKGGYMIYYSMLNDAGGEEAYDRMYYSYADPTFKTLTKPRLMFDWGYATIDADINYLDTDGLYHMMIKKEGGQPGLFTATSETLEGPYSEPVEDDYIDFEGNKKCEGVSAFRIEGEPGWRIAYIEYSSKPRHYRICRADENMRNFSDPHDIDGVKAPQHGSFLRITREEYDRLKAWSDSLNVGGYTLTPVPEAPFDMPDVKEYNYPSLTLNVTDYGASPKAGPAVNAKAINSAIKACSRSGGGHVTVPAGVWPVGSIHLCSNVDLHLEKDAVLKFSDNPQYYLPAVPTSWEGMECYNYSPLVYAYECDNIAITGEGTLAPDMGTWKVWFKRPQAHLDALKELYTKASTDVPVEQRQMAVGDNNMRPHLIHFNRCKNVLLDGFTIRESPFWTIHMYLCDGGIVRNLDVRAHGHNNDGIDLEMSSNFLVEDCRFDQGDDAVVIKSGRNQDAWRLNTPSENIVVRNCDIIKGHCLLGIGSEISGGVRNVYMHDCTAPESVYRLFFLKTNHRRGAFLENITMENVDCGSVQRVLEIDTDVLYQWRDLVPTYETRITKIDNINIRNINCEHADMVYDLKGDKRRPITNVTLENIHVGDVNIGFKNVKNAKNVNEINVTAGD